MRAREARLLLVDDDGPHREATCRALERAGYEVACVVSAAEGRQHVERYGAPDLVLLAVRELSRQTEIALCRDIHAVEDVPVIALAAEAMQERAAVLLEACVDDFITTPATTGEIVARVRRCLRQPYRASWPAADGTARSNAGSGEQRVVIDGHAVLLTDREALLLVGGEAPKPGSRICYPVNPSRREDIPAQYWWSDVPTRDLGDHDGLPDALRNGKS